MREWQLGIMKIIGRIPAWMLLSLFVLSPTTESMYSSALPNLSKYFHISANTAQLTSTLYFLGFAFGILSLGRLSDVWGRRSVVLFGITLYVVSSVASIFAVNVEMLMCSRFLQAFGASVGSVIGQAMARDSYQGSELSYVYTSIAAWLAFLPSVGSSIGGYIVEYSGWKYIFLFLSILYSIMLLIYYKLLPETNPYISSAKNHQYLEVIKVVISDKSVLAYAFIIGAFNGMMFGFLIEAPFILIDKVGISPSLYGKLTILLALSSVFGSVLGSYLIKKKHVNDKKIMKLGLVGSLIGCSMLVLTTYGIAENGLSKNLIVAMIFIPMMIHMVGHNLLIPITLRYALEDYAKVTGSAGSIFGTLYYLLLAIITVIISKLHSYTSINFAVLFWLLSFCSAIAVYLIQFWSRAKISRLEFN